MPTQSATVDLRAVPETPVSPEAQQPGESIHVPRPRPRDLARPVPGALRAPSVAAAARGAGPLGPSPSITEGFPALSDPNTVIPPDTHGAVVPHLDNGREACGPARSFVIKP